MNGPGTESERAGGVRAIRDKNCSSEAHNDRAVHALLTPLANVLIADNATDHRHPD